MFRKISFVFFLLLQTAISFSQITTGVADFYSAQAKERIMNYYSALNLICGNQLQNDEKGIIINETINEMFENDNVYVYNDVDVTNTTQTDFKIKDCLENIKLFYSNSEIAFDVDYFKLSDVFEAKDFYFYKAEATRKMTISYNGQKKTDTKHLDFYIKFIPNKLNCQIYSIKHHEDNLSQFKKATIEKSKKENVITASSTSVKDDENSKLTYSTSKPNFTSNPIADVLQQHRTEIQKVKDELTSYKTRSPYGNFKLDNYGNKYSGEYDMNSQRSGKGILVKSNGSVYNGEFNNGNFWNGQVDEIDNYGNKYSGQYNNFQREGKGTLIKTNGSKYEGDFNNGNFWKGDADEIDNYGNKYTGQYNNFQREGKGTLIKTNGSKYEGVFNGGNFWKGDADEIDNYGNKYTGQYSNFQREGKGTLIKTNGSKYEGVFNGGNFWKGDGDETDNYGNKYTGQYNNFQWEGKGTLIKTNGSKYEGVFQNGNFWSGYADEIDNWGKKFVGQYRNGQRVQ